MLTIHAADLLLPGAAGAPVPGGAVAVRGPEIVDIGPYEEVAARYPAARVRRWPGILTPGLRQWHGRWLLTRAYHPDPREADELGTEPLTGAALDALTHSGAMDESRWAGSVRRGLQRMLRHGTTAVAGSFEDLPAVRTAVVRSGLMIVSTVGAPGILIDEPQFDVFANAYGLADAVAAPLAVGGRADLAAFDVSDVFYASDASDEARLMEQGAATCVATVLGGRLVHRRR